MLRSFTGAILGRRQARFRGIVLVVAFLAIFFIGHAWEDAGLSGILPYVGLIALSISYVIFPNWVSWIPMFFLFVAYTAGVAATPDNGPFSEWIIFLLIGVVPAALLWFARPRDRIIGRKE